MSDYPVAVKEENFDEFYVARFGKTKRTGKPVLAQGIIKKSGQPILVLDEATGQVLDAADAAAALGGGATAALFSRKTSDQSVTASTTLVNATSIVLPVEANSTYLFELGLIVSENGGGIDADIVVPSGAIAYGTWVAAEDLGDGPFISLKNLYVTSRSTIAFSLAGETVSLLQKFIVTTSSTAGNVQLEFAQYTSNPAASTIKAGSWIKAEAVS